MELEQRRPPEIAKKLWHIVRIMFLMMRKGISESKFKMDINLLLQRGNKIAEKAMEDLITFHHHNNLASALTCRPDDSYLSSFISPREYEFSCSNSPRYKSKKRHKNYYYRRHNHRGYGGSYGGYNGGYGGDRSMQRVHSFQPDALEMFRDEKVVESDLVGTSPMSLPGFGRSPAGVRQLRVTDSPFSLKDGGEEQERAAAQVINKQAEEFINEFHKDLYRQKAAYYLESSYYYNSWLG